MRRGGRPRGKGKGAGLPGRSEEVLRQEEEGLSDPHPKTPMRRVS
jgi:hypothetical protein